MQSRRFPVVLSMAGRDKGRQFAVLGSDPAGLLLIADGRLRKTQKLKKKKQKHLKIIGEIEWSGDAFPTNRALWKALREFKPKSGAAGEGGCNLV